MRNMTADQLRLAAIHLLGSSHNDQPYEQSHRDAYAAVGVWLLEEARESDARTAAEVAFSEERDSGVRGRSVRLSEAPTLARKTRP